MTGNDLPRDPSSYPPPTGEGWPTPYGPFGPAPQHHRPSPWRARFAMGLGVTLLLGGALTAGGMLGLQSGRDGDRDASRTIILEGPTSGEGSGSTLPQSGADAVAGTTSDATKAQSTGIVQISSELTNGESAGTGIVLDRSGTIVTNHHVVEGATDIKVRVVTTGRTYSATYVGGDATNDVAVIRLRDASGLTPAPVSATTAEVGDAVTSVGDAGGDGGSLTAAPGSVTATDEAITVRGEGPGGANRLTGLMQLRALVVPGDSGGAVLDDRGEVVGMNVAASANARDVTGYAIPWTTVSSIADRILAGDEGGSVEIGYHGFLGVGLAPSSTGAVIAQVYDDGGAARLGIEAGDTITAVDGTPIASAEQLQQAIATTEPGQRARIAWTSADGEQRTGTVTLGQAPVS